MDQILTAREELIDMLTKNGTSPNKPFERARSAKPKDFKNRHSSILLTFDAIADAINEINKPKPIKTSKSEIRFHDPNLIE